MTYKKAKKKIDILIELANRNYRDQIPDYIKALEMASEALKRQMTMKVFTDSVFFRCGDCGRCVKKVHEYCWFCGQKLDWSEE